MTKITANKFNPSILPFRHYAKKAIRSLFDDQGFIELDTPYLITANTPDPFIDPIFIKSAPERPLEQLHTSPEIWLKQALVLGFNKIYQLGKVFRDDPPTDHHAREFTMLEWYRIHAKLADLITDCEDIFRITADIAITTNLITSKPELSIIKTDLPTLFKELAKIDLSQALNNIALGDRDHLQNLLANKKSEYLPRDATFADAFFHVMLKYIEPNLPPDRPFALFRWPVQLAALAAPCSDDPLYCDRFEIYFGGLEIANAYQECTDEHVLRSRFIKENHDRFLLHKPTFPIDESFLESVSQMPETAGIALGVDRLFQAILRKHHISEIIFGYRDH